MITEQNDKLNRMVKTLLDMSERQTGWRNDKSILDAIVEEVWACLLYTSGKQNNISTSIRHYFNDKDFSEKEYDEDELDVYKRQP